MFTVLRTAVLCAALVVPPPALAASLDVFAMPENGKGDGKGIDRSLLLTDRSGGCLDRLIADPDRPSSGVGDTVAEAGCDTRGPLAPADLEGLLEEVPERLTE